MNSVMFIVQFQDLTGQRFGQLTAKQRIYRKGSKATWWLCQCDCGKERTVTAVTLKRNKSISCGCHKRYQTRHGNRRSNPQIVTYKTIVNQYHNSCRRRSIEWHLTTEEAIAIFQMDCHYCGSPPAQKRNAYIKNGRPRKEWHFEATVLFNGIDRINNDGHYEPINVVPCCFICNRAKSNMTFQEFTTWIQRIKHH